MSLGSAERQREVLRAVYDWESGNFVAIKGTNELKRGLSVSPVPEHLVRLLVFARTGDWGMNCKRELQGSVDVGYLRTLNRKQADHVSDGPGWENMKAVVQDPVVSGSSAEVWRCRFDDGADIGYVKYAAPAKAGLWREYRVYSRRVECPVCREDGTLDSHECWDGWEEPGDEPLKMEHFTLEEEGRAAVERLMQVEAGMKEVADRKSDKAGVSPRWISLADAERATGVTRGVLSRAADRGEIATNGKRGPGRLLDGSSLLNWAVARAGRGERGESDTAVRKKMHDAGLGD